MGNCTRRKLFCKRYVAGNGPLKMVYILCVKLAHSRQHAVTFFHKKSQDNPLLVHGQLKIRPVCSQGVPCVMRGSLYGNNGPLQI